MADRTSPTETKTEGGIGGPPAIPNFSELLEENSAPISPGAAAPEGSEAGDPQRNATAAQRDVTADVQHEDSTLQCSPDDPPATPGDFDAERTTNSPVTPGGFEQLTAGLSQTALSQSDLGELDTANCRTARLSGQSKLNTAAAETAFSDIELPSESGETGYPNQSRDCSLVFQGYHREPAGDQELSFPQDTGARIIFSNSNFPTLLNNSTTECMFVDLTGKEEGAYEFKLRTFYDHSMQCDLEETVAAASNCSKALIHAVKQYPLPPLVLRQGLGDKLPAIVTYSGDSRCLLVDRNTSLTSGLNLCQQWLETRHAGHAYSELCLLRDSKRLGSDLAFSDLEDFTKLELVRVETVTQKLILRLNQRTEKTFYIDCQNTEYIWELKDKFLAAWREEVRGEGASADCVWLTCGGEVLHDQRLLWWLWKLPDDANNSLEFENPFFKLSNTFHVHFQPRDAVLVTINYKPDAQRYRVAKSVVLVSPAASTLILRHEVAKVIHKDPLSFKVFISGKKIEMDTHLETFLTKQDCIAVIEQRPKVKINVSRGEKGVGTPPSSFPVAVHKYETVTKLKTEVCRALGVAPYCMDLSHKGKLLEEQGDLRAARLRAGDTVQALLLPNRIRVRVRVSSGRWEDVVVSDDTVSTVKHLKAYVMSVVADRSRGSQGASQQGDFQQGDSQQNASPHGAPQQGAIFMTAIVKGQAVEDGATLREAGVEMNARVVLVVGEKLCYTADPPGRVPVFWAGDKDHSGPPQITMAMCDGSKFYYNLENSPDVCADLPQLFPSSTPAIPSGIGRCPPTMMHQFPRDPLQPSADPEGRPSPFVCTVCRSQSAPTLHSTPVGGHGIRRSQSDTFNQRGAPPLGDSSDTSGPPINCKSYPDGGLGQDFCDGEVPGSRSDSALNTHNRLRGSGGKSLAATRSAALLPKLSLNVGEASGRMSENIQVNPQFQWGYYTDNEVASGRTSARQRDTSTANGFPPVHYNPQVTSAAQIFPPWQHRAEANPLQANAANANAAPLNSLHHPPQAYAANANTPPLNSLHHPPQAYASNANTPPLNTHHHPPQVYASNANTPPLNSPLHPPQVYAANANTPQLNSLHHPPQAYAANANTPQLNSLHHPPYTYAANANTPQLNSLHHPPYTYAANANTPQLNSLHHPPYTYAANANTPQLNSLHHPPYTYAANANTPPLNSPHHPPQVYAANANTPPLNSHHHPPQAYAANANTPPLNSPHHPPQAYAANANTPPLNTPHHPPEANAANANIPPLNTPHHPPEVNAANTNTPPLNHTHHQHKQVALRSPPPGPKPCNPSGYPPESELLRAGMTRTFTYQESVETGTNGCLVATKSHTVQANVSPEMMNAMGTSFTNCDNVFQSTFANPTAAPAQVPPLEAGCLLSQDTTFTHVKKSVVKEVARNLGWEGRSVLLELVPEHVIHAAETRYPNSVNDQYYDCLTRWLKMKGKGASLDELKQALVRNDRTDLAEAVDRIDAKEQGYETSP